ncbi:MAG TPA: hypothetical protein VG326_03845 [Tepidisphaeraceae bacterium]|jgi:hypothetical protein|nr:hypothetical protein [Tepidisphaeraceae bacterium]
MPNYRRAFRPGGTFFFTPARGIASAIGGTETAVETFFFTPARGIAAPDSFDDPAPGRCSAGRRRISMIGQVDVPRDGRAAMVYNEPNGRSCQLLVASCQQENQTHRIAGGLLFTGN